MDLFSHAYHEGSAQQPLAEKLRPKKLDDILGQSRILGMSAPWRRLLERGQIPSLILWGPPGTGKTTFALLLAQHVDAEFVTVNAVETGAKALRDLGEQGKRRRLEQRRRTLLFIDEIHRLNKGQQDVLLPSVEKGDLILVGATTENPSYEINPALLSRCRILVFERLAEEELRQLAERAAATRGLALSELFSSEAQGRLLGLADGDGRRLLNLMETVLNYHGVYQSGLALDTVEAKAPEIESDDGKNGRDGEPVLNRESALSPREWPLDADALADVLDQPALRYDKAGDEHYDVISAFIKSVRGSDPDAAVYYLARMIKGGEDPIFIARRLVILASEDIGNADPRGLTVAVSGLQAVELIGWPEAAISLAQVTTYLACAPKSNRSYQALNRAKELVETTGTIPVPPALRSAKTPAMKELGYGKGYKYSHEGEKGYLRQRFLPEELGDIRLYEPTDHGFERNIRQYLAWLKS